MLQKQALKLRNILRKKVSGRLFFKSPKFLVWNVPINELWQSVEKVLNRRFLQNNSGDLPLFFEKSGFWYYWNLLSFLEFFKSIFTKKSSDQIF